MKRSFILITGATKGIGRAITELLAAKGRPLVLVARSEEDIRTLIEALKTKYPESHFHGIPTDLSSIEDINVLANEVRQIDGTVDVLINNAGMFLPGSIINEDEEQLIQQWELNVLAVYRLCRMFAPGMIERGHGHIINIGSIAGIKAYPNGGSYGVTKFAVRGLTQALRQELMPSGVRVTHIAPGATWSASWEGIDLPEDRSMPASDIARTIWMCLQMEGMTSVEEVVVRPQLGDL